MKQRFLFLYAGMPDSVRVNKMARYLTNSGFSVDFLGWNRYRGKVINDTCYSTIDYVLQGGGEGRRLLPLLYIVFIILLYFRLLFKRDLEKYYIVSINFETACVVRSISRIKKIKYAYDIWDEMAISHSFPSFIKRIIQGIDRKNRDKAALIIHVDENRVSSLDKKYIIIYNSPFDRYNGINLKKQYKNALAITGWLNNTRGLRSILSFAKDNPQIKFIIAGEFIDKSLAKHFCDLNNVQYSHFVPQEQLFSMIENCRGIFSLYDPSIEINRLAASNKLYDAMMLGIPVISNYGVLAATLIEQQKLGYVVDYEYGDTWDCLIPFDTTEIERMGNNGRRLYVQSYSFEKQMKMVFVPGIVESL